MNNLNWKLGAGRSIKAMAMILIASVLLGMVRELRSRAREASRRQA